MTAWYNITEAETDPGAPPKSELWKAWWKNPLAIAEGSVGAPHNQNDWHPYNTNGVGGNDGTIWSFTVDGAITSITTPLFVDGYDYGIVYAGVSGSASGDFGVILNLSDATTYAIPSASTYDLNATAFNSANTHTGAYGFLNPRVPGDSIYFQSLVNWRIGGAGSQIMDMAPAPVILRRDTSRALTKVNSITLDAPAAGSFDAGKIKLIRRRNYLDALLT